MGPVLLARLLELNDVQEGVLNIAFKLAAEQGLLLIDLADLRALLQHLGENAAQVSKSYGNVSPATIGAIQRRLLVLENEGASRFFGEPELDIKDFLRSSRDGRRVVNILSAAKLMRAPRHYAVFLLWLLSELFEKLSFRLARPWSRLAVCSARCKARWVSFLGKGQGAAVSASRRVNPRSDRQSSQPPVPLAASGRLRLGH